MTVKREVLYNILIRFHIIMKLVRLIEMSLDETYSIFCILKNMWNAFLIQNGIKQGDTLITIAFQIYFRICYQECPRNRE